MDWSRRAVLYKRHLLRIGGGLIRTVFLLGVGYVTLYPLLFMISSSFMSVSDTLDATVVWLPTGMNWFNFQKAFDLMNYGEALKNTLVLVLPCVALQVVSCVFIAYGFARFKLPGLPILFALLLFNIIVPSDCYIIPVYVLMSELKLINTVWQFYIQALFGVGIVLRSVLEGLGDMTWSSAIGIGMLGARIALSYLLRPVLAGRTIAIAEGITWILMLMVLILRTAYMHRKTKQA